MPDGGRVPAQEQMTEEVGPAGPLAVVDVGSNSGRLVVYRHDAEGHLELLEDTKATLRLAHDLQQGERLSEAAMARTLAALKDFQSVARAAGAARLIVVGTSAMREAPNGPELLERIRQETGIAVEIIDGLTEARYSFLGAIHSLPVESGYVLDIGGGSLELVHFRDRTAVSAQMLPLGALRLSTRFLTSDPPKVKEIEALQRHVEEVLDRAGFSRADAGQVLVGTGGTLRRLAKIDQRARGYPVAQVHGYELSLKDVTRIIDQLAALPLAERVTLPGLSSDRVDSILGGALAVQVVLRRLGVARLLISGEGLREGIAYDHFGLAERSLEDVRRAAVLALARNFATWDAARAERRARLATELAATLAPAPSAGLSAEYLALLQLAARLLDIGRSIDYYNRYAHTAAIVLLSHLGGFGHRELARLAVLIREAEKGKRVGAEVALLDEEDEAQLPRLALLLALADEFERHGGPACPLTVRVEVEGDATEQTVRLVAPPLTLGQAADFRERFQRVFGASLEFVARPSERGVAAG